jgi:hypothetical protein
MGNDVFGQIQIVEKISANRLKLIPDVYIGGAAGSNGHSGGDQNALMSLALLQYLTGKPVLPKSPNDSADATPGQ